MDPPRLRYQRLQEAYEKYFEEASQTRKRAREIRSYQCKVCALLRGCWHSTSPIGEIVVLVWFNAVELKCPHHANCSAMAKLGSPVFIAFKNFVCNA